MTTGADRSAHDPDHADPRHPGTAAPVMRSAGSTLIGGALGGLLIISGEFLAAHYLKVQYYGYYAAGMTVARIGEAIATFGLQVAIFHFIPMYRREGRNDLVGGIVIASGLLPPLLGCALALAIWVAAPWLAQWVFHGADVVTYIRFMAFAVPFMALAEILGAITRGFGFAKYYVVVKNLVPPVAFLISVALLDRLNDFRCGSRARSWLPTRWRASRGPGQSLASRGSRRCGASGRRFGSGSCTGMRPA